ncbi:MAG: amidohydrolase [Pseudomonadales bacterium]|nr:amidohydrolase [Pseudomonadales bacterium]
MIKENLELKRASVESDLCDVLVPREHSTDPFACPCCANVFQETLRTAGIDVADHAEGLSRRADPLQGSCLIVNAHILTMDKSQPKAQALWVQDGKIAWVGAMDALPPEALDEETVDCQGKFVMPGFIDPHMHLAPLAMMHQFENLSPFRFESTDLALSHLRNIARDVPPGQWIVGRQFDPSLQRGPEFLTRELLDSVSNDHPIFIYNASLHLAYCNSLALAIGGVNAQTPDPKGAEVGRDGAGEPNGVLKGGPAMALVARHNPLTRQQNIAEACLSVFAHANTLGITMLCDQGTGLFQGVRELDLYRGLRDSQRMTVRLRYSVAHAIAQQWDDMDLSWGEGDQWLRLTGWKIVSDGSNQGRTGLQRTPFLDSESVGIAYVEVDELNTAVEKRLREGWAVCIHANGDAAIDRVLDAFELAVSQGLDPATARCRIEHCSILHDEQIERMAKMGLSPSFLIGHVHYWGDALIRNVFGAEKTALLDRTGACEVAGIRWTIHSDDPVTEMNPLRCIENAVTRQMWRTDEVLSPQECISVDSALRAMTIDAAWQCHSDHEVGSLTVGKYADFIVLETDPRLVAPAQLSQIAVQETWVSGERVYVA